MSRLKTRSTCSLCFRYPNIKRTVINVKSSLQMKLDSEVRRAIDSHLPRNCNETFPRSETMRKLSRIDFSLSLSPLIFFLVTSLLFSFFFSFSLLSLSFWKVEMEASDRDVDRASDIRNFREKFCAHELPSWTDGCWSLVIMHATPVEF